MHFQWLSQYTNFGEHQEGFFFHIPGNLKTIKPYKDIDFGFSNVPIRAQMCEIPIDFDIILQDIVSNPAGAVILPMSSENPAT